MEERRFDDLTRALGNATSRRQVLKGLLGGVVAAVVARAIQPKSAAAASCAGDITSCRQDAAATFATCRANGGSWFSCTQQAAVRFNDCYSVQCPTGQECCTIGFALQCTDTLTDPHHCGGCHVHCGSGQVCADGRCACDAGYTECSDRFGGLLCCSADQFCAPSHTCEKKCDPECPPCQECVDGECHISMRSNGLSGQCSGDQICCQGECVSEPCCAGEGNGYPCASGMVCCSEQCVSDQCPAPKVFHYGSCDCQCRPVSCPRGQQQDPDTCKCTKSCTGQPDGTACGTNKVCCGDACIDACSSGKTLDTDTCTCVCTPVTCDPGLVQDPDTCQCVNRCANVTCDTCQECDPTTGDCVPMDDGSACASGICCNSQCVADCDADHTMNPDTCTCECTPVSCPSGQVQDPTTCLCGCNEPTGGCPPPTVWYPGFCQCIDECTFCADPRPMCCRNEFGAYCCESYAYCCPGGCCYS